MQITAVDVQQVVHFSNDTNPELLCALCPLRNFKQCLARGEHEQYDCEESDIVWMSPKTLLQFITWRITK